MSRKMKDSGIEWIGEIPEDWEIVKVKNIFNNHKNIVCEKENEYERLALTLNGVIKRSKEDSKGLQSKSFSTYQIIYENDLVFKLIDLENVNTSRVGKSPYTGIVSPVYIILSNERESAFGYYYFLSLWHREIFNKLGGNGVRSALNLNDLNNLPYPQFDTRMKKYVAEYLDSRCTLIDKTIEKQKQVIEKLKEYKQSLITEAVIKGLDPNVPMKDSGIEWVGKIPKKYEVIIVKRIFKSILGKMVNDKPTGIDDSLEKYLCALNVHFDGISLENVKEMYFSPKEKEQYELMDGDLLVVEGGAGAGGASIVNFCNEKSGYYIQNSIHLVRSANGDANLKYLFYNLYSLVNRGYIDFVCNKATIPHFTKEKLLNVPIINRTLAEQNEIVNYLDEKCEMIDEMIRIKVSVLSKLESYKKSLIYECVTGKREVK